MEPPARLPGVVQNARCSSQEELDQACTAAAEKAAKLRERLRIACEAMRKKTEANGEPQLDRQGAFAQKSDAADEVEAESAEQGAASWAAVHRFEGLLQFAAEVQKVRASTSVAALIDSTGVLSRFDTFAASQYQEVLRAAEAESRRCDAEAEALQSARATLQHLLAEQKQEEEACTSPPKDVKEQLRAAKKAAELAVTQVRLAEAQLHHEQAKQGAKQEQLRTQLTEAKEAAREADRQCVANHAALYALTSTFPELLRDLRSVRRFAHKRSLAYSWPCLSPAHSRRHLYL